MWEVIGNGFGMIQGELITRLNVKYIKSEWFWLSFVVLGKILKLLSPKIPYSKISIIYLLFSSTWR